MRENVVRQLEDEGWEIMQDDPINARRDRGDRSEALFVGEQGHVRYTRTRVVGDEQFSTVRDGAHQSRVVTRTQEEVTVTTKVNDDHLAEAIEASLRAAGP